MFQHGANHGGRGPASPVHGDPNLFAHLSPFPRFGLQEQTPETHHGVGIEPMRRAFGSSSLDWTAAASTPGLQTGFDAINAGVCSPAAPMAPSEEVEMADFGAPSAGVSNLIAHFENIHGMPATSRVTSPTTVVSQAPDPFESFHGPFSNRIASPTLTSPGPSPFESIHGQLSSRVASPTTLISPASAHFGNLGRVTSPISPLGPVASPISPVNSPAVQNFFRPPVPSTPKPLVPQHAGPSSFSVSFRQDPGNGQPLSPFSSSQVPEADPFSPPPLPQRPAATFAQASVANQSLPEPHAQSLPESSVGSATPTSFLGQQPQGTLALRPQTGTRPSREQVPAEAWESFKTTIRQLYLDERRPLKEVMQIMAERYNFQATPKMYKTRFSQWGFVKNNTEEEVKRLLSMKFQRDAEGKVSEFVRNGRVVNLGTYLKRKGVTEYDLVDFEMPADLPSYVRCRTPTPPPAPGYLRSPDLLRAQETVVQNTRKAFIHCRQFELQTNAAVGWSSTMLWAAGSSEMLSEANKLFEKHDHDKAGHMLMQAFQSLEEDLKQLSPPGIKEMLLGMVHRDPGMMTALSKYLAAYSTTNYERSHPLRLIFTSLYEVQQKHGPVTLSDLVWGCLPTIAEELEAIYGRRHPYVARTWIDLATSYNHASTERLEKLVAELGLLRRAVEAREGANSAEDLTLRYCIVQLTCAAYPGSDAAKQAVQELWEAMRATGQVYHARASEPDVYCYHSLVKVAPWMKRCRDRYLAGGELLQRHCRVRVLPYFEEDMHTTEHAPDAMDSFAVAVQYMPSSQMRLI